MEMTLLGATRVDLGAMAIEVLCIPQSSSIPGTSQSDCLASYLGHSLGEPYPTAEIQSACSTVPADWPCINICTPEIIVKSMEKNTQKNCLVWLFNGISTFVGYLMPKSFSEQKNSSGTI